MANEKRYSNHLETLIALVTNLAMTRHRSRTPRALAKYLSLDYGQVLYVLTSFKGLFRESIAVTDNGEHYYTLQLRYARRWLEDEAPEDDNSALEEPLEADYLSTLLNFISGMIANEQASARQYSENRAALIGAWVAAIAAIVAAIVILIANLVKV